MTVWAMFTAHMWFLWGSSDPKGTNRTVKKKEMMGLSQAAHVSSTLPVAHDCPCP